MEKKSKMSNKLGSSITSFTLFHIGGGFFVSGGVARLLALAVFVLVMLGGMLGLSFVAIEATKESHVKSDGLVVGTSGQIVKTDIAESEYPFFGLTALAAGTLGRIHTVTVAIELPEIAENRAQEITVATARPPGQWPTQLCTAAKRSLPTPPFNRTFDISRKSGTASSTKESVEL